MRVVVVDDAVEVRRRLVAIISERPGVKIVGEADGARTGFEAIKQSRPDVAVLDIQMQDGSGIDVLERVKEEFPATHVIMLTNHANPFYRRKCMEAGADYFLDKSADFAKVDDILRSLASEGE